MKLEQMMSEHYPDSIGFTIKGPEERLDSIAVDVAALMQAKGYDVYSSSRMIPNERALVFLNEVDRELARERHHASCRNSAGSLLPKTEVVA